MIVDQKTKTKMKVVTRLAEAHAAEEEVLSAVKQKGVKTRMVAMCLQNCSAYDRGSGILPVVVHHKD